MEDQFFDEPFSCSCLNGGLCHKEVCIKGFVGERCQTTDIDFGVGFGPDEVKQAKKKEPSFIAGEICLCFLFVLSLGLVIFFIWRRLRSQRKSRNSYESNLTTQGNGRNNLVQVTEIIVQTCIAFPLNRTCPSKLNLITFEDCTYSSNEILKPPTKAEEKMSIIVNTSDCVDLSAANKKKVLVNMERAPRRKRSYGISR